MPCVGCAKRKAWLAKQAANARDFAKKVVRFPGSNAARRIVRRERVPPGQGKPAVGTASAVATGDLPLGAPAIVHVYIDGADPKNGGHQPEGAPCPTS